MRSVFDGSLLFSLLHVAEKFISAIMCLTKTSQNHKACLTVAVLWSKLISQLKKNAAQVFSFEINHKGPDCLHEEFFLGHVCPLPTIFFCPGTIYLIMWWIYKISTAEQESVIFLKMLLF